ncbi:MAG: LTA synthase family protein [Elusimicrobiota bacterium]
MGHAETTVPVAGWRMKASLVGAAASRFLDLVPALVIAMFCLRAAELTSGIQTGSTHSETISAIATAISLDLLNLIRYLPALFLYSLPFLLVHSRRASRLGLGLAWSLLTLVQTALFQYFLTARVPLGADLFAYSWDDIRKTVSGGTGPNAAVIIALPLALIALWAILARQNRRARPTFQPRTAAILLTMALLVLVIVPGRPGGTVSVTEDTYNLTLNKSAYFFDTSVSNLAPLRGLNLDHPASATAVTGFHYLDPKYPFLRVEQTPDVLGPHFNIRKDNPPNLVFIIVEGLGRAFSGPGAALGSFTPQLDRLAETGLYWENFLAVQGRTFAILPSVFASLPFGAKGFSDLGEHMPAHTSLMSVLKNNGYRMNFYIGFNLDFDKERAFLRRQGVDMMMDENNFGPEYTRANSWGYGDNELVSLALKTEASAPRQPFLSVIQTITMHTPYTFPGQSGFYPRFERRLDELGITKERKDAYRAHRDIYTAILYADSALGRFFEEMKKNPAYQNTIFIVTGDHRLPEIPMSTRIDRYHVPLIIVSPLLHKPARIKSVSSQFDITPSLLAFFSHNYGILTPHAVTWLGSGLDMEPSFRNIHDFPLKQTIANLVDFVSGTWFINQNTLYALNDGMNIEPDGDTAALARVQAQFTAFRAANDQLARSVTLIPDGTAGQLSPYRDEERIKPAAPAADSAGMLSVQEVHAPGSARPGALTIEAVFANTGTKATDTFVPLIVLLGADGREVSESYAAPQRISSGKTILLQLPVNSLGVPPGNYFLSVIPSHPETGKKVGVGRYRIPIRFHN